MKAIDYAIAAAQSDEETAKQKTAEDEQKKNLHSGEKADSRIQYVKSLLNTSEPD